MTSFAAIKKDEGPIPDLRPPKGRIAFDTPETAILNGAVLFAFVVLVIGRIIHARKPVPPKPVEPPIVLARRALEAANGPTIIADCEQIVRRYVFNAFGAGWEGATSNELCANFASDPRVDGDTHAAFAAFLGECDLARFAAHETERIAATCVSRALALVEQLEARRTVAEPPPLPVAT